MQLKKTLVATVLLFLGSILQAEEFRWRNVEISGGGWVTGIKFHPTAKNLLYARTDVGGVFKWGDNARWQALNDAVGRGFGTDLGILALALDPTNAARVYALSGMYTQDWSTNGAVLISEDQGAHWLRVPLPFKVGGNEDGRGTGERLVVDPQNPKRLWLGTNQDGLWRSDDYGRSWQKVMGFPAAGTTLVTLAPASLGEKAGNGSLKKSPTGIYVASTQKQNALYYSGDDGKTWVPVAHQPQNVFYHRAAWDKQQLLLTANNGLGPNGITDGAVWRYNPQQAQWTNISPPKGQGGFAGLAVDPNNTARILVGTTNRWWPRDDIYYSEDAGASWKPIISDEHWNLNAAPLAHQHKPNWLVDIAFDPNDGNRAWVVTGYGVLESKNINAQQTVRWEYAAYGLEQTVILELVSPPKGAYLYSVMGDMDGFRHDDLNVSPNRFQPELGSNNSIAFAYKKPEHMARIIEKGPGIHIALSTDAGKTWALAASEPSGAMAGEVALSAKGKTLVWTPAKMNTFYSKDKGASWRASQGLPLNLKPIADTVKDGHFYAYDAEQGQVYYSRDGAKTFKKGASGLPKVPHWLLRDGNLRVMPNTAGHLMITTGAALYRSKDGGKSVQPVSGVKESYLVSFGKGPTEASKPSLFVWGKVGGELGYYLSDDDGLSFKKMNKAHQQFGQPFCMVGDMQVHGRLYLGTSGRGVIVGELIQ